MLIPRLNGGPLSDPEVVYGSFYNNSASTLPKDSVAQVDISTNVDGIKVSQPTTAGLIAMVGIVHADIAASKYGLVQIYGFRSTSKVLTTDTSQPAGVRLIAVNAQDYAASASAGDTTLILVESHTTSTGTVSKKVFIKCM
jgi:hypothetical protein